MSKINSENINKIVDSGRNVVRTSAGVLYSVICNDTDKKIEVWKSTDDGASWSQQDANNSPEGVSASVAIDSTDKLVIPYQNSGDGDSTCRSIDFDTGTDTFTNDQEQHNIGSGIPEADKSTSIAIGSDDKVHIAFMGGYLDMGNAMRTVFYTGDGSNHTISDTGTHQFHTGIIVDSDNYPILTYFHEDNSRYYAWKSTTLTPGSWEDWEYTDVGDGDYAHHSVTIDSNGVTWVGFIDPLGNPCISKEPELNWEDEWTVYNSGNSGQNNASVVADGTDIYLFYIDNNGNVAYDKYDGEWKGEEVLETGTYEPVKAKFSRFYNYGSDGTNYGGTSGIPEIDYLFGDGTDVYWNKLETTVDISETKTHTVDSLLHKKETKTHTVDSYIEEDVQTESKTHTTDSLLKSRQTDTHAIDSLLKKRDTDTHAIDSYLLKRKTNTHSSDSFLITKETKTHSVDSLLKKEQTNTHSIDSLLKGREAATHSLDSYLIDRETKSHDVDSYLFSRDTKTHSIDSLLNEKQTAEHNIDGLLRKKDTKAHTIDSLLLKKPTVEALPADEITQESAKTHGRVVDDGGESTEVRFEYRKK